MLRGSGRCSGVCLHNIHVVLRHVAVWHEFEPSPHLPSTLASAPAPGTGVLDLNNYELQNTRHNAWRCCVKALFQRSCQLFPWFGAKCLANSPGMPPCLYSASLRPWKPIRGHCVAVAHKEALKIIKRRPGKDQGRS